MDLFSSIQPFLNNCVKDRQLVWVLPYTNILHSAGQLYTDAVYILVQLFLIKPEQEMPKLYIDGKKHFTSDEYLTVTQIKSLFSRSSKKLCEGTLKNLRDVLREKDYSSKEIDDDENEIT